MIIQRGYKVELDPTNEQVPGFAKACGIARFAYNWALHRKEAGFRERNLNRTVLSIKNELNRRKREEFPWMYEVSKCVSEEALWDLDEAYKKFFRHLKGDPKLGISMARFCKECNAMRFGRHFGAPSFRSRRRGLGSFRIDGSRVRVYADRIQIQTLGLVRLKERGYIPWEDVRILNMRQSPSRRDGGLSRSTWNKTSRFLPMTDPRSEWTSAFQPSPRCPIGRHSRTPRRSLGTGVSWSAFNGR